MLAYFYIFVFLLLLPALASATAEPIHVTGRLQESRSGTGLAGATVEFFAAWEGSEAASRGPQGKAAPAPLATARTDAQGWFDVAAPESGLFRLVAKAEGFLPMEYSLALVEDTVLASAAMPLAGAQDREDVLGESDFDVSGHWRVADRKGLKPQTPRPEPPRRIAGKVINAATKKPVAGAWVWAGWPLVAPGARTDAEGVFQLAVPPGVEVGLESVAAGYLPGERQHVKQGASGPVVLSLRPAASLAGKVVDGAGQPVAGARVETVFSRKGRLESVLARSRGDGNFRLTGLLPSGVYELTATHESFMRQEVSARTAPAGQTSAPVRIVMTDGLTAFGRVVDGKGSPVSGAEVTLSYQETVDATSMESWRPAVATSNAEGRFEIRHLRPGPVQVGAKHPGFSYGELPAVKLPPGQPRFDLGSLTLPAGAAIEGRVTDVHGAPLGGARVWITPEEEQSGFGSLSFSSHLPRLQEVEAGKDGRFRIADLQRGQAFVVGASHPGYVDAMVTGVQAPNDEPLRIEMKAAHGLRGQVVGPLGEPVAGASLSRALGLETFLSPDVADPLRPLGTTDSEGRFAVTGLAPGPFNLQVRADGYQPRKLEGLEIPEDRDLTDLKIALERGAWLAVRVLDGDEPVRGVTVMATPDEKTLARYNDPFAALNTTETDAEGRCRFGLPGPGVYNVSLFAMRGGASQRVEAGLGATPVELRLPSGTEVSGQVLDADGSIVPGAVLQLNGGGGEMGSFHAQSDADGTFVFSRVADGHYVLTARGREGTGRSSSPLDVEVAGQPVRNLDVRLDRENPAAVLTGRLLGLAPGELSQVFILAHSEPANYQPGKVDPAGGYRIEGLSPGTWTVEARLPLAGRLAQGTVEIEPGAASASLDLEFAATFQVTGRVVMDGSPLANALVVAQSQPEGNFTQAARTAADGTFALGKVPAGTLLVAAVGPGGVGDARKAQISANQEILIEFSTGRLSGRIVTLAGDPVEDASITILGGSAEARAAAEGQESGSPLPDLRSGADGTFVLPRITAGTYTLTIEKKGFAPQQATVDVPPGGEGTVEVRLTAKGGS